MVQVQRGSTISRPRPMLDILPSYVFGSKLKRVGGLLHGTSQQDMVFVSSERYIQDGATDTLAVLAHVLAKRLRDRGNHSPRLQALVVFGIRVVLVLDVALA